MADKKSLRRKPKIVEIPGVGVVEFPGSMSDEDIARQIQGLTSVGKISRGLTRFVQEESPAAIGATLGATVGTAGGPLGTIAGGGLGGAAGEAAGQIAQRFGSPIGRPVETSAEAATQIGTSGALSALGEGAVQVGGRILRPVLRRLSKTEDAVVPLLRSERTGSKVSGFAESVAEKSLPGAGRFETFRRSQQQALANLGDTLSARISGRNLSSQEAGELFAQEISAARGIVRDTAGRLYGEIDQLAKGVTVKTSPVKKAAKPLLDEINKPSLVPAEEKAQVKTILQSILDAPDELGFGQIQRDRSDLLRILRRNKDVIGDRADRIISILETEVDSAMEAAARNSATPNLIDKVRTANRFWAENISKLNSKLIRSLLNKDKDEVVAAIFRRGSIDDIELVKKLVTKDSFQDMKGRFLRDVLDDSTRGELAPQLFPGVKDLPGLQGQQVQVLDFKSLQRALERQGEGRLKAIFDTPEEIKALGEFLEVAGRIGGGRAKGLANSLIAWSTNGYIIYTGGSAVISGDLAGLAGVAAASIGINLSSRLMTNPQGLKLLTAAMVTNRGTTAGARIAAQLIALSQRERRIRSNKPELKKRNLSLELTALGK